MMNTIKRLKLEEELTRHHELLITAATSNLFYTAKHECDICISIKKKIDIINNQTRR